MQKTRWAGVTARYLLNSTTVAGPHRGFPPCIVYYATLLNECVPMSNVHQQLWPLGNTGVVMYHF